MTSSETGSGTSSSGWTPWSCAGRRPQTGRERHDQWHLRKQPNFTAHRSAVSIGMSSRTQAPSPTARAKDEPEREWAYLPRWRIIVIGFVLFTGASLLLEQLARTNTRGLVIDALILLSAANATSFYWVLSATTVIAALGAVLLAIVRVRGEGKRKIVVTRAFLMLPTSSWSNRLLTIDYRAIRSLSVRTLRKTGSVLPWQHRLLQLDCSSRKYSISSSQLPSEGDFDEICAMIAARMPIERRPLARSPKATVPHQAPVGAG